MTKRRAYKEERFRTPLATERAVGLWVDRIGSGTNRAGDQDPDRPLRLLGQYAVVSVATGAGYFESPAMGRRTVQAGQVMVLFPDEPHRYDPRVRWTTQWIVWNGPDAKVFEQLGYLDRGQAVIADPLGCVDRAFSRLTQMIGNEDLAAVLERKNIVSEMVLDLFKETRRTVRHRHYEPLMREATAFLAAHYAEALPLDDLCRRFNLSPAHFRRLFKEYSGRSPREFLIAVRISRAKELLSQGRPVKEVARRVGYEDIFYFMRIFKKTAGISPGKFTFIARPG